MSRSRLTGALLALGILAASAQAQLPITVQSVQRAVDSPPDRDPQTVPGQVWVWVKNNTASAQTIRGAYDCGNLVASEFFDVNGDGNTGECPNYYLNDPIAVGGTLMLVLPVRLWRGAESDITLQLWAASAPSQIDFEVIHVKWDYATNIITGVLRSSYTPSISPHTITANVQGNTAQSQSFTITNTGSTSATYALAADCGTWASSCVPPASSVTISGGGSASVSVGYTTGLAGTSANIRLSATGPVAGNGVAPSDQATVTANATDIAAPTLTVSPSPASGNTLTLTAWALSLIVTACDTDGVTTAPALTFNGASVAPTATATTGTTCPASSASAKKSTYSLALNPGANTVAVSTSDGTHTTARTITYVYDDGPEHRAVVTALHPTRTVELGRPATDTFSVRNPGPLTAQYTLSPSCVNPSGLYCGGDVAASTITLASGATTNVVLSYWSVYYVNEPMLLTLNATYVAQGGSATTSSASSSAMTATTAALEPTRITLTPAGGALLTSSTFTLTVDWCDHDDVIQQHTVWWRGQQLSDAFVDAPWGSRLPDCKDAGTSTYTGLTIPAGASWAVAQATDNFGHVKRDSVLLTYVPPVSDFRPHVIAPTVVPTAARGSEVRIPFVVTNAGIYTATYEFSTVCAWACGPDRLSATLAPGDMFNVGLLLDPPVNGTSAPASLIAKRTDVLGRVIADTGRVTATAVAFAPLAPPAVVPADQGMLSVPASGTRLYAFTVTNTGTVSASYQLDTFGFGGTWSGVQFESGVGSGNPVITLGAGESRAITVLATAPPVATNVPRLHLTMWLVNTPDGSSALAEGIVELALTGEAPSQTVAVGPPNMTRLLAGGTDSSVVFTVTNTGTAPAPVVYSATCTGVVSCLGTVSGQTDSLGHNVSRDLTIRFHIAPGDGGGGLVTLTAHGAGGGQSASGTWTIGQFAPGAIHVLRKTPNATIARDECLTISIGDDAAYECGDLRLVHALPTTTTMNKARTPTLIYSSLDAHPVVRLAADVVLDGSFCPSATNPLIAVVHIGSDTVQRPLRWAGNCGAPASGRVVVPIDVRRYSVSEGVHHYALEVRGRALDGTVVSASDTGTFVVVDRGGSPFGAGWWLDGLERLMSVSDTPDQLLWIGGDGSTRLYTRSTTDATVFVVKEMLDRPDTLQQVANVGYRRRLPNGAYVEFNQFMQHAATVNARGDTTRFAWSGTQLTTIKLPMPHGSSATRSYTFNYTNGLLASVIAPTGPNGSRVTGIVRNGSDLAIADPGAAALHYTVASDGRISARTNRLGDPTRFWFHDTTGVLVASTLDMSRTGAPADSIHQGFCPAEASGLIPCAPVVVDSAHLVTTYDGPREDLSDVTTFWLTPFGAPAKVVNAIGQTTTIERRDQRFPLLATKTIAPSGFTTTATYNDRGLTETQTAIAPFGGDDAITRYFWNSPGALTLLDSVRAPTSEMSRFGYFANGDRKWQEDARGSLSHVEFGYNGNRQLSTIQQPGRAASDPPDVLAYEPIAGNLQSSTTSGGARTTYHTDAIGRVDTVNSPIGTRTAPLLETQADSFDLLDQVLVHRAIGPPSHYDIGAPGGIVSGTAPAETLTVTTVYDLEGRALSVKREANANLAASGAIVLRSSYDAAGRKITATDDQNNDEHIGYDKAGNVTTRTMRRGNVIRTTYDALNRPSSVITQQIAYGADQRRVTDEPGNPPGFVDRSPAIFPYYAPGWAFDWMQAPASGYPNLVIAGDTSTFTYDVTGGISTATNSVARITRTYFANGALKSDVSTLASVDTMGELVGHSFGIHRYALNYLYDLSGRRTTRTDTLPNCVSCAQVYSYVNGFLDQTTDRTGRFRFNYHPAGWLSGWTAFDASNAVVAGESRNYDADGRMTTRTVKRGVATDVFNDALQYDDANRVLAADVTSADNAALADHVANAYSGLGALAAMKRERNAVVTVDEYLTDAFGRQLTRGARNATSGPAVASDTMIYAGERLAVSGKSPRRWSAGIEIPSSEMDTTSYEYDQAGNQKRSRTMVASFFGGSAQTWRRVLKGWTWTWNAYGGDEKLHVSQRTFWKDSVTQRTAFVEYFYDALGRRVQTRTRWDQHCDQHAGGDCQSSITRTVWDGDQILTELRNDNVKHVVDTHPRCIDGSDIATNPDCTQDTFLPYDTQIGADLETEYSGGSFAGAIRYTHAGGIDQPIALWRSDMSAGVVPLANWRGLYEAGAYIGTTNAGVAWPAWNQDAFFANDARIGNNAVQATHWLGAMVDGQADAAGMRYMRNRYYDSKSGRFTQEDPIGLGGGVNLYGFAGGDPINANDPFGLCCFIPGVPALGHGAVTLGLALQAWHDGPGAFYAQVSSLGMAAAASPLMFAGGEPAQAPRSQVLVNSARGRAFEEAVASEVGVDGYSVSREVTLETPGGARTRMDIVATKEGSPLRCIECKSSSTARLTAGQKAAHPQIATQGATVVGKGKPGVPGGTKIPPTSVEVRRP